MNTDMFTNLGEAVQLSQIESGLVPKDYFNDTINKTPIQPITKVSSNSSYEHIDSVAIQRSVTDNNYISLANSNLGSSLMVVVLLLIVFLLNWFIKRLFNCLKFTRNEFTPKHKRGRILEILIYSIAIVLSCYLYEGKVQDDIQSDYAYCLSLNNNKDIASLVFPNPTYIFTRASSNLLFTNFVKNNSESFKIFFWIKRGWTVAIIRSEGNGKYEKYYVRPFAAVTNENNPLKIMTLTRKAIVGNVFHLTLNSATVTYNKYFSFINAVGNNTKYHQFYLDTNLKGAEDGMIQCWPFPEGRVFVKYECAHTRYLLANEKEIFLHRLSNYLIGATQCFIGIWIIRIILMLLLKLEKRYKNARNIYLSQEKETVTGNSKIMYLRHLVSNIWAQCKSMEFGIAILMLISLLDMPYNFYTIIRFLAMASFGWLCYSAYKVKKEKLMTIYLALAILYQPIFKISIERGLWMFIDTAVAILLLIIWRKDKIY